MIFSLLQIASIFFNTFDIAAHASEVGPKSATKISCKDALEQSFDEDEIEVLVESIISEFNSFNSPVLKGYSSQHWQVAVKLVAVFGNTSEAAKLLGIQKIHEPILRIFVSNYEKTHNVQIIKSLSSYSNKFKHVAVLRVRQEGGNVRAVARKLNVSPHALRRWVINYEKEHGVQIRNTITRNTYSDEFKHNVVLKVIEEDGNVSAVARKLDVSPHALRRWVTDYEEKHDMQIKNTRASYSDEFKHNAVMKVIEKDGNIKATARKLNVNPLTLRSWVADYEEEHDTQIRNTRASYSDEFKHNAVLKVKEEGGNVTATARKLGVNPYALRRWVINYEKERGVQIRNTRK